MRARRERSDMGLHVDSDGAMPFVKPRLGGDVEDGRVDPQNRADDGVRDRPRQTLRPGLVRRPFARSVRDTGSDDASARSEARSKAATNAEADDPPVGRKNQGDERSRLRSEDDGPHCWAGYDSGLELKPHDRHDARIDPTSLPRSLVGS